jgi:alpha-D-ribose 1-methylphosphonate 5-triphosphate synthase subunit PhnG
MERSRRTRILIQGAPELRRELCRLVSNRHSTAAVDDPRGGLVMIQARETAKNGLFYLGELLVTEAKVQIEGRIGLGIIAGDDREAARELAVIDAAYNAGLEETSGWDAMLIEEEARILSRERAEAERVARTKVAFESMDRG